MVCCPIALGPLAATGVRGGFQLPAGTNVAYVRGAWWAQYFVICARASNKRLVFDFLLTQRPVVAWRRGSSSATPPGERPAGACWSLRPLLLADPDARPRQGQRGRQGKRRCARGRQESRKKGGAASTHAVEKIPVVCGEIS